MRVPGNGGCLFPGTTKQKIREQTTTIGPAAIVTVAVGAVAPSRKSQVAVFFLSNDDLASCIVAHTKTGCWPFH